MPAGGGAPPAARAGRERRARTGARAPRAGRPGRAREAFLAGAEEHPPEAFAGIGEAVETILAHVGDGGRITIHGDYDVDGVCSTAVLVRALRGLGANVDSYLPDRASDGYGLNADDRAAAGARGTRLLVTRRLRDHGRRGGRARRAALGMDVVVTDHHAPRADGALPRRADRASRRCAATRARSCARRPSRTSSPRRCSRRSASGGGYGPGSPRAARPRAGRGPRPGGARDDRRRRAARGREPRARAPRAARARRHRQAGTAGADGRRGRRSRPR